MAQNILNSIDTGGAMGDCKSHVLLISYSHEKQKEIQNQIQKSNEVFLIDFHDFILIVNSIFIFDKSTYLSSNEFDNGLVELEYHLNICIKSTKTHFPQYGCLITNKKIGSR